MAKTKRPRPIAPPPMKSRKKSRQITSLFHKLTQQMDYARANDPNDKATIQRIPKKQESIKREMRKRGRKYESFSMLIITLSGLPEEPLILQII